MNLTVWRWIAGNLYVADYSNNTIRKMTLDGTNWVVTTPAGLAGSFGSVNGTNSDARFNIPTGVAVDSADNVYVADAANNLIRKMTLAGTNWVVTTLAGTGGVYGSADGTGMDARFLNPSGVAVDSADNIYVADTYNNTIRKVTPARVVTTLGGIPGNIGTANGTGSAARFSNPAGLAVDGDSNIYVADYYFNTIRKGFPVPVILNSGFIDGQFGFNLTRPPGQLVIVEASPDLVSWLSIRTNTFAGILNFSDPRAASLPIVFTAPACRSRRLGKLKSEQLYETPQNRRSSHPRHSAGGRNLFFTRPRRKPHRSAGLH